VTVAALFVESDGVYQGLDDVDPWDISRDARSYLGPHPVVAHPPCKRWGNFWMGRPGVDKGRFHLGDDGGCFAAALASVRAFGGVLEHPKGSRAWGMHGLTAPSGGGWCASDFKGGWSCLVDQGHFGHPCPKSTWLYAVRVDLPSLDWSPSVATGRVERQSRRDRLRTPPAFRDLLLSMARSVR